MSRLWRVWFETPLDTSILAKSGVVTPFTRSATADGLRPKSGMSGLPAISNPILTGQRRKKHSFNLGLLEQNDELLYSLMLSERDWAAVHKHPDICAETSRYGVHPLNYLAPQVSLYRLRSTALTITRDELAAYVGCADMTVYRQETTRWLESDSYPHWPVWYAVLKWSKVRYSHMSQHKADIACLEKFVSLQPLSRARYRWYIEQVRNSGKGL